MGVSRTLDLWRIRFLGSIRCAEALALVLVAAGLTACMTQPIPLSAQIGSTIAIPLGEVDGKAGYGGADYTDHQRGELVFQLVGTDPLVELTTRFSIATTAHPASIMAGLAQLSQPSPPPAVPEQLISLVDVTPSNQTTLEPGTYSLSVIRRRPGKPDKAGPNYTGGQIRILPASIDIGGGEFIDGAPTELKKVNNCSGFCNFRSEIYRAIPRPSLTLTLESNVAAFDLDLSYPANVIDIVDVIDGDNDFKAANQGTLLWFDDNGAGSIQIRGVSHPDAGVSSALQIDLVFELDDGASQTLNLSQDPIVVEALNAYDLNGQPISASVSIGAIH